MISLFKSKNLTPTIEGYFPIITDIHSHILPGIDDGSPNIETSITLIKQLISIGITASIATPHIIGDLYRNDSTTINAALQKVKNVLKENEINFSLSAAAEYMMDDYFLELLHNKAPLLTLKDNIILTEFSYAEKPYNPQQMAFSIITEGYQPILAHPERYGYYHNNFKQYNALKDLGFLLQVNLLSLTGYYGKQVAKAAEYIIKNDLASFTATDLHHQKHMDALLDPSNHQLFAKAFNGNNMNEEMTF